MTATAAGVPGPGPHLSAVKVVVADAAVARQQLVHAGVEASEVDPQPWGSFVRFRDPDGNTCSMHAVADRCGVTAA